MVSTFSRVIWHFIYGSFSGWAWYTMLWGWDAQLVWAYGFDVMVLFDGGLEWLLLVCIHDSSASGFGNSAFVHSLKISPSFLRWRWTGWYKEESTCLLPMEPFLHHARMSKFSKILKIVTTWRSWQWSHGEIHHFLCTDNAMDIC